MNRQLRFLEELRQHRLVVVARRHLRLAHVIVALACGFNAYALTANVLSPSPSLNDDILHVRVIEQTVAASHRSLTLMLDPWVPEFDTGYPFLHSYQPLAFLTVAAVDRALFETVSVPVLYRWSKLILLVLFPLCVFMGLNWLGLGEEAAAYAGLASSLLSTVGIYGFDWLSYTWRGFALYSQLWGACFLPLALGRGRRYLHEGRGLAVTVALISATLLSHVSYGYMLLVSLGVVTLVERSFAALKRGALMVTLALLVTSFFILPAFIDRIYTNPSVWMPREKFDSTGAEVVLNQLFSGQLLDNARVPNLSGLFSNRAAWRIPLLSLLLALGAGVAVVRKRLFLGLFVLWLALYFGRPTWGHALDYWPLAKDFHFHRLSGAVHLFALALIGVAAEWIGQELPKAKWLRLAVFAFALAPLWDERLEWIRQETYMLAQNDWAFARDQRDLDNLWQKLRELETVTPGRVYAGFAGNWGKSFVVGSVPVYGLTATLGFETIGFLYHAMSFNGDLQMLFDDHRQADYDLFMIGYVIAPKEKYFPSFVEKVDTYGRFSLYKVANVGRTSLVSSRFRVSGTRDNLFVASKRLRVAQPSTEVPSAGFDTQPGDLGFDQRWPVLSGMSEVGSVATTVEDLEHPQYEVEAREPAVLYVRDTYHPNWQAKVDGQPVQPLMMLPSYIGVPVPAGPHRVQVDYTPGRHKTGLFIFGIVLLLGLIVRDWLFVTG